MKTVSQRLEVAMAEEGSSSDRLRRLLALSSPDGAQPARQKVSDILAGRRPLPAGAEHVLAALEARAALRRLLEDAWERFGATVLWSIDRGFALDPAHAEEIAEELRHGSTESFLHADLVLRAKSELDRRQAVDHAAA
jgi:hypothetical protein